MLKPKRDMILYIQDILVGKEVIYENITWEVLRISGDTSDSYRNDKVICDLFYERIYFLAVDEAEYLLWKLSKPSKEIRGGQIGNGISINIGPISEGYQNNLKQHTTNIVFQNDIELDIQPPHIDHTHLYNLDLWPNLNETFV